MKPRQLFFERGQGWLRWGYEDRTGYEHHGEGLYEPVPYRVAPPLRRLALYLRQWVWQMPRLMLVGFKDDDSPRYRYSWEEARPEWPSDLKDEDR